MTRRRIVLCVVFLGVALLTCTGLVHARSPAVIPKAAPTVPVPTLPPPVHPPIADLATLLEHLVRADLGVVQFREVPTDLEDAFLTVTRES